MHYTWGTVWCNGIGGMPLAIAVTCSRCSSEAQFIPPFEFFRRGTAQVPNLRHWNNVLVKEKYPGAFSWQDRDNPFQKLFWGSPKHRPSAAPIMGVLKCPACTALRKHRLDWPRDAFYQVNVDGKQLWAWDRRSLAFIRDHIEKLDRPKRHHPLLRHLPTHFLVAKRRDAVLAAIDGLLQARQRPRR
jgi:hypothetical protein